jgi:hypothetical protein
MNLTCFYCQTPFTLSMDQKIAALRKMHAENLHHYDAHCPRCGRANAISRERLEMFTPGWEEAIKEPAMANQASGTAGMPDREQPNTVVPSPVPAITEPEMRPAAKKAPARKRHAPAAKKVAKKAPSKKTTAKKAPAKKAPAKKTAKSAKKKSTAAKSKSSSKKTAKKSR